ncbi:YitT family protein [Ruminiclostridium papyrosolvens]|uniref:Membrane protein n=1 Tax=Ruminiclostridium papyrosolvens C7 TaxID=1330534 RepID=U4R4X1_9FIRM|nr:YitT family protein [Ruminiclostridium papyrosolvens]EPR13570.1 membrane protein [Ruminiclostridium papyrosolvens C7]
MTRKNHIKREIVRYIFLFIGSVLAATGLEIFLIPNNIIDGGIVGISIITSYLTKLPVSLFIIVLNIPFLFLGYKQIGKTFVLSSLFSVVSFSFWVQVFHPIPVLTSDILLASVFGGIVLGIGVGIIIRYGGSLDGTEMVAIIINKRTSFSVGEMVMFFNVFILSSAGLVFGWNHAMYSLIAYFIAYKVIDIIIEGLDETKAAIIISESGEEIAKAITARLGRGVTFLDGKGGFSKNEKTILYSVVTRLEVSKLKSIIYDKDENAFVTINDVSEVMGGKHKKRAIH